MSAPVKLLNAGDSYVALETSDIGRWVLLEDGELIVEGDELFNPANRLWQPVVESIGMHLSECGLPVRRQIFMKPRIFRSGKDTAL